MLALRRLLVAFCVVLSGVAYALTPGERVVLFSGIKPVWQANFLSPVLVASQTLPSGLTYTKSGSIPATLFDSTGKLTYQGNNLFTYSGTMVTNWSGDRVTFSANSTTAPDGTNTANTLTVNATGNYASYLQTVTALVGTTYIFSLYVKAGTTDKVTLYFGGTTITAASVVSGPGSAGSLSTGVIFSGLSSSQWSRIQVTATPATASRNMVIYPNNWNVNTTGDSIYVWGPQLEAVTYQTTPSTYNATTANSYLAPRLDTNPSTLAPAGLLVEEQRVQIAGYNRDLTNAVWTASNITPLKNMTGLDGVANSASRITAGANNGTILQTITLASSQRAQSAYLQRITGSGTVYMTTDGGTTWVDVTSQVGSPGTWARATIAAQTVTNPSFGFKLATSGDAIGVDIVQNEGGAFATSAIPNPTSSTVTRTADVVTPTTYAAKASIWQRKSESAGTTARTYYAPGALPSPFDTGYWYQSMAAYSRALTTAEQTPRLVVGAPY